MSETTEHPKTMDCLLLYKELGPLLSECISEIIMKCPSDPIEYMGHWLHKHVRNVQVAKMHGDEMTELARHKVEYAQELEIKRVLKVEADFLKMCEEKYKLEKEEEERNRLQKEIELDQLEEEEDEEEGSTSGEEEEEEEESDDEIVAEAYRSNSAKYLLPKVTENKDKP